MKILIVILTLFAINFTYAQDTLYYNNQWESSARENAAYYRVIEPDGDLWTVKDFYLSGELQMTGKLSQRDPIVLTGECTWFRPDGLVHRKAEYENGKENGIVEEFDEEGKPKMAAQYRNGKPEGQITLYYPNGKPKMKGKIKDSQKEGLWQYWNGEGKLVNENTFADDFKLELPGLQIFMPNNAWYFDLEQKAGAKTIYAFRKEPQSPDEERANPNISIIVEPIDTAFNAITYSAAKRAQIPFNITDVYSSIAGNIGLDKSIGYKGFFAMQDGRNTGVFVIHSTNHDMGIQIIMESDMSYFSAIEPEFLSIMEHVKYSK